jgi:hypothetical protein
MALELKQPSHRELSGGDLLAQCLRQLGVEVAFGVHGGHLDAFLVGCAENDIRLVDTRHEEVAIQAAQGYAKVSHKAGVAFVTANSGYGNSLPGIATAFADRSPVVVVTSSPPLRDAETNCLQGSLDQVVVATPMTKFAHRIVQAEEIPRLVAHAHRVACTGAPGVFCFPLVYVFLYHDSCLHWSIKQVQFFLMYPLMCCFVQFNRTRSLGALSPRRYRIPQDQIAMPFLKQFNPGRVQNSLPSLLVLAANLQR